jgi:hypothetical protein
MIIDASTLVVNGDAAHSDLESILMNKAMRVLDKEEIVFDLERQKLELELKLLDKKFDVWTQFLIVTDKIHSYSGHEYQPQ